ncbi:hypothetical protein ElyMa_004631600 [Elysia marginata]|uniref:Uncharacterized protein n=1 Tax=Elysia marginata TaxID=1093978 RepID=A0AAV4I0L1_9GAST|nr:hypothetical protein ElyMa_004631600 [Elysia marginata]
MREGVRDWLKDGEKGTNRQRDTRRRVDRQSNEHREKEKAKKGKEVFTGHIYRARGIEQLAMTGKINGKKSRGRQRTTYVDSLNTWANLEQHTRSQFMRFSCERQIWKTMTVNACSRHGT